MVYIKKQWASANGFGAKQSKTHVVGVYINDGWVYNHGLSVFDKC